MKNKKGFTLIALLIIASIIGLSEVVLLNPTKKVGGKPISLKHLRIKSLREN